MRAAGSKVSPDGAATMAAPSDQVFCSLWPNRVVCWQRLAVQHPIALNKTLAPSTAGITASEPVPIEHPTSAREVLGPVVTPA